MINLVLYLVWALTMGMSFDPKKEVMDDFIRKK
jgi:hypothetical protein